MVAMYGAVDSYFAHAAEDIAHVRVLLRDALDMGPRLVAMGTKRSFTYP